MDRHIRAREALVGDGADGARTRDLRAASATLSQLSYGPWTAKSSGEFVVLCPIDSQRLVVTGRAEPKQDGNAIRKLLDRQEVTPIDLRAVGRICIDVLWRVVLTKQPASIPPIAMARDSDDISMTTRPLALDADESGAKIEIKS